MRILSILIILTLTACTTPETVLKNNVTGGHCFMYSGYACACGSFNYLLWCITPINKN